jgi:phosphatidate cytidylyltransferase
MLRWRILLGVTIVSVLVGLCWLDSIAPVPGMVLFPLLVLSVLAASREVLQLVEASGMQPLRWVVYCGNLLLVSCSWGACLWREFSGSVVTGPADVGWQWSATASMWTLLALAGAVLLAFVAEMRRFERPGGATGNLAAAMFSIIYLGLLLSFVVQLRMAWGISGLASMVIVVKMSDTGAYTVGRLIGRNKMAPGLSPGKTIEGAAGALVFACVGSWLTFTWINEPSTPWQGWLLFGLLVGVMGMAGDLAESLLKRDAMQKNSSDWMPGFGGVLDIFDSMLLAAPVAFACWAFGLVGSPLLAELWDRFWDAAGWFFGLG